MLTFLDFTWVLILNDVTILVKLTHLNNVTQTISILLLKSSAYLWELFKEITVHTIPTIFFKCVAFTFGCKMQSKWTLINTWIFNYCKSQWKHGIQHIYLVQILNLLLCSYILRKCFPKAFGLGRHVYSFGPPCDTNDWSRWGCKGKG